MSCYVSRLASYGLGEFSGDRDCGLCSARVSQHAVNNAKKLNLICRRVQLARVWRRWDGESGPVIGAEIIFAPVAFCIVKFRRHSQQ